MAGIAADGSVLHFEEMLLCDHIFATGHGNENVSDRSRFSHAHDPEPIHYGFHRFDWIDFGHYHPGTQAFGSHRDTFAAPTVSCHNHIFSGNYQVGGSIDSVPDRLSRAVAVVKEMLAIGVVHQHHREHEFSGTIHGLKPKDTSRGLFTSSNDIRNKIRIILMDHRDEISAIIDNNIWLCLDDFANAILIFLRSGSMDGENVQSLMNKGSRDIILGGQRIASGDEHLGATIGENLAKTRCLGLQMNRQSNP